MDLNKQAVLYCIINSDLKMGVGKIAAQAGHAFLKAYDYSSQTKLIEEWKKSGSAKIVLRATEETLLKLIKKYSLDQLGQRCFVIYDAGKTQVEPHSLTAIAFQIIRKGTILDLEELKLL